MHELYSTSEEYASTASDTYDNFSEVSTDQITIDGYPGYKLEFEQTLAGYPTTSFEYSFLTETDLVLYYGHADPAVFEDYRDEFENSIESFRSL